MTLPRCAPYHPHWASGGWFICFPHEVCVYAPLHVRVCPPHTVCVHLSNCLTFADTSQKSITCRHLPNCFVTPAGMCHGRW